MRPTPSQRASIYRYRSTSSRWLARRAAASVLHNDIDGLGDGIEDDLHFSPLKLTKNARDFPFKRQLALAVVGTLTQHEGFNHSSQCRDRQRIVRYLDRIARFAHLTSLETRESTRPPSGVRPPALDGPGSGSHTASRWCTRALNDPSRPTDDPAASALPSHWIARSSVCGDLPRSRLHFGCRSTHAVGPSYRPHRLGLGHRNVYALLLPVR